MNEASVGHQCPECVAEGRRSQRAARTVVGGTTAGSAGTVTSVLVGLNVAVMIISVALGGLPALLSGNSPLVGWGDTLGYAAYFPGGPAHGVAAGEYYRLITATFLHLGIVHLGLNMWALWSIGRQLEAALGRIRFLALYLVAGLGGSVADYVISPPNHSSAGASGAIFGLFATYFVVLRRMGKDMSTVIPTVVMLLIFTFVIQNVSIFGHIGGFMTGGVLAVAMAYAPRKLRMPVQVGAFAATCLILVALVVWRTLSLTGG
jgi:membrane associated rhomboid family serine protease